MITIKITRHCIVSHYDAAAHTDRQTDNSDEHIISAVHYVHLAEITKAD